MRGGNGFVNWSVGTDEENDRRSGGERVIQELVSIAETGGGGD